MSFGRLQRAPAGKPFSDINVTPLVDVMLVLVVIFIITAPLLGSAIKVALPKAEAAPNAAAPRHVVLVVDRDGQFFLNDLALDAPALARALAESAKQDPDTEVQLRADTAVPYGRVVEAMGLAQKAGLHRLAFVAQAEKP